MARVQLSKPWQNAIIHGLNYGMVALFAITLAYWVWVFIKPQPTPVAPPEVASTQTLLPSILASHWFGSSHGTVEKDVYQGGELKLVGLLSPSQRQAGFAIFKLSNGQQQYAVLNQEITAGVKLEDIQSNSVTIVQNGIKHQLPLENPVDSKAVGIIPSVAEIKSTPVSIEKPSEKPVLSNQNANTTAPSPSAPTSTAATPQVPVPPESTSAMIQRYIKELPK